METLKTNQFLVTFTDSGEPVYAGKAPEKVWNMNLAERIAFCKKNECDRIAYVRGIPEKIKTFFNQLFKEDHISTTFEVDGKLIHNVRGFGGIEIYFDKFGEPNSKWIYIYNSLPNGSYYKQTQLIEFVEALGYRVHVVLH